MGNGNDDRDDDLTRIENLTEFIHEEDSEVDSIFETLSSQQSDKKNKSNHDDESVIMDLDELENELEDKIEDNPDTSDLPPAFPEEILEDSTHFSFENTEENSDVNFEELTEDLAEETSDPFSFTFDSTDEQSTFEDSTNDSFESSQNEAEETIFNETSFTENNFEDDSFLNSPSESIPPVLNIPEKLADLKQFASEFSYGKSNIGAGNPPFSIILRNIKYKDDVEDIKRLLNEFEIMNEHNQADFETSLEMGALLISQVSEFSAIVLAHKLRRFDLDLEVGLSDEINPPKSGEKNAKGLIKKETIKQNTKEQLNLADSDFSIADIIMTTSQNIPNYKILDYNGVHSVMSIIDEDDLEKLQYVDKTLRDHGDIFNLPFDGQDENSTKDAFLNYQKSFSLIFDELKMRLKQKAYSLKANAVLGVSFQVSPVNFQSNTHGAYSITCSATFAKIIKE